jgi:anti-sigma factor RsiW
MRCPIESQQNLELLLDYGTGRTASREATEFQRHLEACTACREAAAGQQTVRSALDLWETPEVSASFNRQLYQRIEQEAGWRERVVRLLRLLLTWRGVPIAATACLIVTTGIVLEHQQAVAPNPQSAASVETAQPEQVVNALDDMEMLGNFVRSVPAAGRSEL